MFRFDCTFSNFNCTKRVQLHTILRPARDRTSDVSKLVAQLHSAPTAACQAERQAVLPVWRCRSRASSAPMPRQVTARLDLTQTAGCCEAVSTPQNSSKQSLRCASASSDRNLGRFPGREQHTLKRLRQSQLTDDQRSTSQH